MGNRREERQKKKKKMGKGGAAGERVGGKSVTSARPSLTAGLGWLCEPRLD